MVYKMNHIWTVDMKSSKAMIFAVILWTQFLQLRREAWKFRTSTGPLIKLCGTLIKDTTLYLIRAGHEVPVVMVWSDWGPHKFINLWLLSVCATLVKTETSQVTNNSWPWLPCKPIWKHKKTKRKNMPAAITTQPKSKLENLTLAW